MHDPVDALQGPAQGVGVAHVAADAVDLRRQVVGPAAGMDPLLQGVVDPDLVAALEEQVDGVGADESGAAGDQDLLHVSEAGPACKGAAERRQM